MKNSKSWLTYSIGLLLMCSYANEYEIINHNSREIKEDCAMVAKAHYFSTSVVPSIGKSINKETYESNNVSQFIDLAEVSSNMKFDPSIITPSGAIID